MYLSISSASMECFLIYLIAIKVSAKYVRNMKSVISVTGDFILVRGFALIALLYVMDAVRIAIAIIAFIGMAGVIMMDFAILVEKIAITAIICIIVILAYIYMEKTLLIQEIVCLV